MVMEARVTRGRVDGDGGESDKGALSMVMESDKGVLSMVLEA